MTLRECYAELGADFEGTLGRLCKESLVKRFALAFLSDESFSILKRGMEEENYEVAFRGAHTLKGVCLNLGFTRLYEISNELADSLRYGKRPTDETIYEKIQIEYNRTIALLREFKET